MKAILTESFGAADVMQLGDVPTPIPGAGQLLIRVAAAGVNRPDIIQRQGHYPPPPGESEILGLECAGTIDQTGPGVEDFEPGDRVFALVGGGAYAEYTLADARHVLPIPEGISFEIAASIAETFITAWLNLFRLAALQDGETVLVHGGGGGVGTAAAQLVNALCPKSPIIATASAAKLDRIRSLGADIAIDYRSEDFAAAIKAFTDGRGTDVILDHIGAANLSSNLKALAVGGRLIVIGIMGGDKAELSLGRLMVKRQRIIGSVLRPRPNDEKADIIAGFRQAVLPLLEQGKLRPIIDSRFPLAEAVAAHRRMESNAHFGKIVLMIDENAT